MTTIIETFSKAGFPLGFVMFGVFLIFRAKRAATQKYLLIAIGMVMALSGLALFGTTTLDLQSNGDCSPNQVIAIGNRVECK